MQLATELDSLLTARGLDAIAAADLQAPDRFVAALAFPKAQLLVVDAVYPAPALMRQEIAEANTATCIWPFNSLVYRTT